VTENTPIIEASSGSTAISEAYFARLLQLPFIAVMPRTTSSAKIAQAVLKQEVNGYKKSISQTMATRPRLCLSVKRFSGLSEAPTLKTDP